MMSPPPTLHFLRKTLHSALLPLRRSRRNGKIARLPKELRDLVNELLSDGATYAQIVQRLNESTDPPLPYQVAQKNISKWHDGGYQDWLQHQDRMEFLASKLDFALDLARNSQPEKLQELSLQLAAIRLCEFLSDLAIADPQTDPTIYLRLLSALPRISREALNIQKYRDAAAHAQAQALAQTLPPAQAATDKDHAEACRTAFLNQMDDIMGLKSYRHLPAAEPQLSQPGKTPKSQIQDPESPPADTHELLQTPNSSAEPQLPLPDEISESKILDPEFPPTDTNGHPQTPTSQPTFSFVNSALFTPNSALPTPPPATTQCCVVCGVPLPSLLPTGEPPTTHCALCDPPLPLV